MRVMSNSDNPTPATNSGDQPSTDSATARRGWSDPNQPFNPPPWNGLPGDEGFEFDNEEIPPVTDIVKPNEDIEFGYDLSDRRHRRWSSVSEPGEFGGGGIR